MKRIIACFLFVFIFTLPASAAKMVVQKLGYGQNGTVLLSPHGKLLAFRNSDDGRIEIWQAQHGECLTTINDQPTFPTLKIYEHPVTFSNNENILFTSVTKRINAKFRDTVLHSVCAREMPSGTIIHTYLNIDSPFWSDGNVIRNTDGKTIQTWRVSDGALLSEQKLPFPALATKDGISSNLFSFSRNGKYLAYAGRYGDAAIRVWNTDTGNLLHKINRYSVGGSIAISDSGQYLLAQAAFPDWKMPKLYSKHGYLLNLQLWDLSSGQVKRTWPKYYENFIGASQLTLNFFDNGNKFSLFNGDLAEIGNILTGKIRSLKSDRFQSFSADGQFHALYGGNYEKTIYIKSTQTQNVIQQFPGKMSGGPLVTISADNAFLASYSDLYIPLRIWDLKTATLLQPKPMSFLRSNNLHWESNYTLISDGTKYVTTFTINKNNSTFSHTQEQFSPSDDATHHTLEHSDTKLFVSLGHKYILGIYAPRGKKPEDALTYVLWDGKSHQLLKSCKNPYPGVDKIYWLPSGNRFIAYSSKGLSIWDVRTLEPIQTIQVPIDSKYIAVPPYSADNRIPVRILSISRDGRYMAGELAHVWAPTPGWGISIWDLRSGKFITTIPYGSFASNPVEKSTAGALYVDHILSNGVSFTVDDRLRLIKGTRTDQQMVIVDWKSGATKEFTQSARSSFSPQRIFATGDKSSVKIYSASSGKLLAQCAATTDSSTPRLQYSDWLIWTPQGYFNAPDHGRKRVRWKENGQILPLDSPRDKELRKKYCNPQIVAKLIAG